MRRAVERTTKNVSIDTDAATAEDWDTFFQHVVELELAAHEKAKASKTPEPDPSMAWIGTLWGGTD